MTGDLPVLYFMYLIGLAMAMFPSVDTCDPLWDISGQQNKVLCIYFCNSRRDMFDLIDCCTDMDFEVYIALIL